MLYIFHVDTGTMMTFEMNLALESVRQLKDMIERSCRIPVDKQVLLVSGGESLDSNARVCSYAAGTDTNPIYLFSKSTIENSTPPSPSVDYGSDMDLKDQVESSLNMPATYNTVVARCQLAKQFFELSQDQSRICEGLVHDQHLQQQGWAAVVANLEDITSAFRTRSEMFEQNFLQYLGNKETFTLLLSNFKEDLNTLSRIQVLPALLSKDEQQDNEEKISLLQWIASTDHQNSLEQVAEHCFRHLKQFDQPVLDGLRRDIETAIIAASKSEMKEIKGLEERLYGLEQLMFETRRIVQEQSDLAQAFSQNQARANNLGDASILPDLCASHRRQLKVMLKNHEQLLDIRRRCTRAKEELSVNLYHRLRWIVYVESSICEVADTLLIYHDSLKRLRKYLDVVQQIHLAPQTYIATVAEVVRRKTFSKAFLHWSGELSTKLDEIHKDETNKRQTFMSLYDGHFLLTLFPGLNDLPPAYATESPPEFDAALPELTNEDLNLLRDTLPELASALPSSNEASVINFFLSYSMRRLQISQSQTEAADSSIGALLQPTGEAVPADFSPQPSIDIPSLPREDRGFESETDTEEFEKVGQSPIEPNAPTTAGIEAPPCFIQTSDKSSSSDGNTLPGSTEIQEVRVPPIIIEPEYMELFTTADFYIDESIPSSCVDSNDTSIATTTTTTNTPIIELSQLKAEITEKDTIINLLQENLGSVKLDEEKMRVLVHNMGQLALKEKQELNDMLKSLSSILFSQGKDVSETVEEVRNRVSKHLLLQQKQHDETINKLEEQLAEKEHELVIAKEDLARSEAKEGLIRAELEAAHTKSLEQLRERLREENEKELNRQLTEAQNEAQSRIDQVLVTAEDEKIAAIKEITDKLNKDHKLEMEGLLSRFKMVHASQMERSPSDTSLEKIERGDLIDITQHEAILQKLRTELEEEKSTAIADITARERRRFDNELDRERDQLMRQEAAKQVAFNEALRRVAADKDRQLESLRSESEQLRTTVERLSQAQTAAEKELTEQRETIKKFNQQQQQQEIYHQPSRSSNRQRHVSSHESMSTSVAVLVEGSGIAGSSPETTRRRVQDDPHLKDKLSRSTNTLLQQGMISVASCNVGDYVLVIWDEEVKNYTILQESSTIYFLHSDSLETLGLSLLPNLDGAPRRNFCLGQVAKKEYCFARKAENRFGVPKDTKFYRVMVRPAQRDAQGNRVSNPGSSSSSGGMSSSQQFNKANLSTSGGPGNSSTL